jgi:prepilin-type N-terminal cleavage/methylation domain-containing protein
MNIISHSQKYTKQEGFTLIELVVVIVIIGILAAIALPKISSLTSSANSSALKATAANLSAAQAADYANKKVAGTGTIIGCTTASLAALVSPALGSGYAVSGTAPACILTLTVGTVATTADFSVVTD